ncbi:MAG: tetratricopeptide repeat protein, partial [Caulobacteraceae bacterium]|nr:tetratricopeptide repeat protein [Caulobacter sp.]
RLSELLVRSGRPREAAQATAALAPASRDAALLFAHAEALKADNRREEALEVCRRARDLDPANAVAWHNLASVLADLHRHDEALEAADRARALGLDAAVAWVVRAHALQGLNRLDEAASAFAEALRRDPRMPVAVTDLARLTWMRTGDQAGAAAVYDRAFAAGASDVSLLVDKARLLEYAGDRAAALAVLAPATGGVGDPRAHVVAAQIAAPLDPDLAARHAEAAVAARPDDAGLRLNLAEARLAQGRPEEAAVLAAETLAATPLNQGALAVQATAWRLTGDPRYAALYDYPGLVGAYAIETPEGWPDLAAFLRDLAAALHRLHALQAHPVGQSLRGGAQTGVNLLRSQDLAIRAAFRALDAPIRAHIAALGKGRDPVRSRVGRGYRYAGAWSVRLRPGGRHVDHVHPQGWLSSAFYVDLPAAVEAGGREGWIKFGEPGLPHGPQPLSAEHWVKPEPGKLVLFPSYMWHGTVPFGGEASRLTLAFDLVPA